MVKQSRDANRITEINQINKAMLLFQSFGGSSTNMGTHGTVYVSIPSDQADCSDLSLPALGGGYVYACKPSTTYRNIDGTGWIPVDLTSVQSSAGILFSSLPIDPINTVANDYYYTYIPGSWALSATMESEKYIASNAANDGGQSTSRFETGNKLVLNANLGTDGAQSSAKTITAFSFTSPSATGVITEGSHIIAVSVPYGTTVTALVASFTTTGESVKVGVTTQASGSTANNFTNPVIYRVTAADSSYQDYVVTVTVAAPVNGFQVDTEGTLTTGLVSYFKLEDVTDYWGSNNLTNNGSATFVAGKINNGVNLVRSSGQYLSKITNLGITNNNASFAFWIKLKAQPAYGTYFSLFGQSDGNTTYVNDVYYRDSSGVKKMTYSSGIPPGGSIDVNQTLTTDTWYFVVATNDGVDAKLYLNNVLIGSSASGSAAPGNTTGFYIGKEMNGTVHMSTAVIDEFGAWSRALTVQEMTDLYNGGNGQTMSLH